MSGVASFVDVHCHLLPEIDDGSTSWDESLAMARLAVADGISTVIVTPHQLGSFSQNRGDAIRTRCKELQEFLQRHGVRLRVLPGADVRIEPEMIAAVGTGDVLTLADRHRHLLLELPHELFLPLDGLLVELESAGLQGILSHPERNRGILDRPATVDSLVDAGCLMQVTAGSLLGAFGNRVKGLSERLITAGLVHFVATDAHGSKARRPLLARAFDKVAALAGHETACELFCDNPSRVAAGRSVTPGRQKTTIRGFTGWFRRRKAG